MEAARRGLSEMTADDATGDPPERSPKRRREDDDDEVEISKDVVMEHREGGDDPMDTT